MKKNHFSNKFSGFSLIEMLVFIFIFSVVSLAFYRTMVTGIQVALDSKNRLGALALANEKMEVARNLRYEDVGTESGIPSGILPEEESVSANGLSYQVKNVVQFVDDEFDGLAPTDTVPDDYKIVKIKVSWGGAANDTHKEVNLASRFVPPGLEVGSGDGVLSIHVVNSAGAPIPQALVHVVNNNVSPAVNISQETDDNGNLIFPGAKQSIQHYELTVSKSNYETVQTIAQGSVSYFPIDVHASVVTGLLNTKSVVIDLLSSLLIKSVDQTGAPLPNLDFHLEGGRVLGSDTSVFPARDVYVLDADESTDADGEKTITNHSPGQFFLDGIESVSGYTLVGVSPISGFEADPLLYKFSLLPDEEKEVEIKMASNSADSLLVKVLSESDNSRINGAQARLSNGVDYDTTLETSFDGVVFFPDSETPLAPGDYTLEVTAGGFGNYSETVTVGGLVEEEVKLTAV